MKKINLIIVSILLLTFNSKAQFTKIVFPDSVTIVVPEKDSLKNKLKLPSGIYKYKTTIDIQFMFSTNNEEEPTFINLIGKNAELIKIFTNFLGIEDKNLTTLTLIKTGGFITDKTGKSTVGALYKIDTGEVLCKYCNSIKFLISPTHNKIILFASDKTVIIFH